MHEPGGLTIALSGASGSGKSTLAAALAVALRGRAASFGQYVRHRSGLTEPGTQRETLQNLGEAAVRAGVAGFVGGFVAWADAASSCVFIADGVRHSSVDRELRRWSEGAGRAYVLVHLLADDPLRAARRTAGDAKALSDIDAHPVERETVDALPWAADMMVGPDWLIEDVVQEVLEAATPGSEDVPSRAKPHVR